MKVRGWAGAIALVVAVNAFVLARVAANRRGGPESSLTLTEREMPLAYVSPKSESSGVSLRFNVEHFVPWAPGYLRDSEIDPLAWLDADKLAALGFRVSLPSSEEDAELLIRRQLPRDAFAVLELGGPAWERYRGRLAERFSSPKPLASGARPAPPPNGSERTSAERELRFGSRLFIVDVGNDPAALRRQYPDRDAHLIAPVEVRVFLDRNCASPRCRVRGAVTLLIDEVNVPRQLQAKLLSAQRDASYGWTGEHAPRYEVVLKSGSRHEPWIDAIHPVASAP